MGSELSADETDPRPKSDAGRRTRSHHPRRRGGGGPHLSSSSVPVSSKEEETAGATAEVVEKDDDPSSLRSPVSPPPVEVEIHHHDDDDEKSDAIVPPPHLPALIPTSVGGGSGGGDVLTMTADDRNDTTKNASAAVSVPLGTAAAAASQQQQQHPSILSSSATSSATNSSILLPHLHPFLVSPVALLVPFSDLGGERVRIAWIEKWIGRVGEVEPGEVAGFLRGKLEGKIARVREVVWGNRKRKRKGEEREEEEEEDGEQEQEQKQQQQTKQPHSFDFSNVTPELLRVMWKIVVLKTLLIYRKRYSMDESALTDRLDLIDSDAQVYSNPRLMKMFLMELYSLSRVKTDDSITVKYIISNLTAAQPVKTLMNLLYMFTPTTWAPSIAKDGIVHSGLFVGGAILDWNESQLARLRWAKGSDCLIAADVTTVQGGEVPDFVHRLSDFVVGCNTTYVYKGMSSLFRRKNQNEGRINCQEFARSALDAVRVEMSFAEPVARFLDGIRTRGLVRFEFRPRRRFVFDYDLQEYPELAELGKIDRSGRNALLTFSTHVDLDAFVQFLFDKHDAFETRDPGVFALLKAFDRAFWLRHVQNDGIYEYVPLRGCPFKDPRDTRTNFQPDDVFGRNVDIAHRNVSDAVMALLPSLVVEVAQNYGEDVIHDDVVGGGVSNRRREEEEEGEEKEDEEESSGNEDGE